MNLTERNKKLIDFIEIKSKDIFRLAELAAEIWHEYWVCILSEEQIDYMVDKFQSEKAITSQIANENYVYFYITYDFQKIGYIGLSKKENYLFLSKLYIKKDYRHKGFGGKAFDFIKEYAFKNNFGKIRLTVNKYNENTIKAYYKWGFKTVDSVITDIGKGFVMDDYIMEYNL